MKDFVTSLSNQNFLIEDSDFTRDCRDTKIDFAVEYYDWNTHKYEDIN